MDYFHIKIIPSLEENDNRFIATFDDDIIYIRQIHFRGFNFKI